MGSLWEVIGAICSVLCWIAPFTFVYFLIYAIGETVKEGNRNIEFGFGAATSLLVIVAAILLK